MQVGGILSVRCLIGQAGQALQPELTGGAYFVAFLREDDGEETVRQIGISAHLRSNAQEQARLAAATRADDDLVRVRAAGAIAQHLDHRLELARPYAERRHQFVVAEESGVVLPTGTNGHRWALRASSTLGDADEARERPYRTRHQSSSRPDRKQ